jgi:hypothetical protein
VESDRFDGWVRTLTTARSRRGALAGLLAGTLGLVGLSATEAKKHKKKKKKKGGPPPIACTPACEGKACGDDGCGGSCGACGAVSCVAGACSCAGQPDSTGCGGGRQCSGGVCATPPPCGVFPDGCASALDCCGNVCDPAELTCPVSAPGNPCHNAGSCSDGATCVGFICQ